MYSESREAHIQCDASSSYRGVPFSALSVHLARGAAKPQQCRPAVASQRIPARAEHQCHAAPPCAPIPNSIRKQEMKSLLFLEHQNCQAIDFLEVSYAFLYIEHMVYESVLLSVKFEKYPRAVEII